MCVQGPEPRPSCDINAASWTWSPKTSEKLRWIFYVNYRILKVIIWMYMHIRIYMYKYIVCYVYNLPSENSDFIYDFFVSSGSLFGRPRTMWQGLWISSNSQCPLIHPSICPISLPRTLRSHIVMWWNSYLKWGEMRNHSNSILLCYLFVPHFKSWYSFYGRDVR